MSWPVFPSLPLAADAAAAFFTALAAGRRRWQPVAAADGRWQLRETTAAVPAVAQLPALPVKKLLFPPVDPLWTLKEQECRMPAPPPPALVAGLPLCELQAVGYLDRFFADDPHYRQRRAALLLIGAPCAPDGECACQAGELPLAGDLFWDGGRLWALSAAGLAQLEAVAAAGPQPEPVPLPGHPAQGRQTAVSAAQFTASAGDPLWEQSAAPCLSCGVCSAVCPTCCCYEVLDAAGLDGTVERRRVWDNCFFAEHARVAGGHDFRAGRGARLRFRFEHKRLGFGTLRGLSSCVGCGRCRRNCPVGIDLEPLAVRLAGEGS